MATLTFAGLEAHLATLGLKTPIPHFPDLDVLRDPLDLARAYLADQIYEIVQCNAEHAFSAVQLPTCVDPFGGDLSIILPRLAREAGLEVEALRDCIIKQFPKHALFSQPAPDGKQVKIYFRTETFARIVFPFLEDRGSQYRATASTNSTIPRRKVLIEFSSPNIVAELNGKHFRSTLLGAQLASIHQAHGWDVTKISWLGDYGKPIGLLGAGYERFGDEKLLASNPIGHLRDVHKQALQLLAPELAANKKAREEHHLGAEVHERTDILMTGISSERDRFARKLEDGDEKMTMLWRTLRDESIRGYEQTFARLKLEFDEYSGESRVKPETMSQILQTLRSKELCEEREGSLVVDLQKHGIKHGTAKLQDRAGSSTYLLRDIAAAIDRHAVHGFDKMLYVVASDQHTAHFHQMFKVLELLDMGELAQKLHHISFHKESHLPEPSTADEPMDTILDRFEASINKSIVLGDQKFVSSIPGVTSGTQLVSSACYAQSSTVKRTTGLKFDMDRLVSFEPGAPLYVLRWLSRLTSVAKPPSSTSEQSVEREEFLEDFGNATLVRWIAHFPAVALSALRMSEPALIMSYLQSIMTQLSESYDEDEQIVANSLEHARFLDCIGIVISGGSRLLNITQTRLRDSAISL